MSIKKLNNYISKRCDKIIRSKRSNYYRFGNQVLRVSDHIGVQSSGHFSIIVDKRNNYMLHSHKTGVITALTYDKVKEFVNGMAIHEDLATNGDIANWKMKENEQLALIEENEALKKEIADLKKQNGHLGNVIGGYRMNAKKAIEKEVDRRVAVVRAAIPKINLK